MPLYMDILKFGEISVEEVKKAHTADKSIQDQFGVKYHQFWVNEEAGLVFYLVEGPDKETCQMVHQTAHGDIACNIIKVEPGYNKLLMGDGQPVDYGLVQNDPCYRHIMVIVIRANTNIVQIEDYRDLLIPLKSKNLVLDKIILFKGRVVEKLGDDSIIGVFDHAVNAVRCAKDLKKELLRRKTKYPDEFDWNISFRIGLYTGQPLTEHDGFFKKALTRTRRLCLAAKKNEVIISSLTSKLCNLEDFSTMKSLTQTEESFIFHLLEITEKNLSNTSFNIDRLARNLGISRPQLYRKIVATTGHSPNGFIYTIRMSQALYLMRMNFGNISEIALEVGFQSPSYFTKCFQKFYGCTPSEFNKIRNSA